jgi:ribonuclease J
MVNNVNMARDLGYLKVPPNMLMTVNQMRDHPPHKTVIICTGSQGEPTSALTRMADGTHQQITIQENDTVILSSNPVPGNEKSVYKNVDQLMKAGAKVIYNRLADVHVRGHAAREELKIIHRLVRPRYFVPIHGEYRQLARHARVAALVTSGLPAPVQVLTAENGDVIRFDRDGGRIADKTPTGRVLIDGTRVGEVNDEVLRDRKHIGIDGLVMPIVVLNAKTGVIEGVPELLARGFVSDKDTADILAQGASLLARTIEECSVEERTDPGLMKERIRTEVRKFLRKETGRRPMVLPVVMEI